MDFSFEIHYESEEISMEKVVHLFEVLKTTFHFKKFRLAKAVFGSVKFGRF
jgi:hypothetical protein